MLRERIARTAVASAESPLAGRLIADVRLVDGRAAAGNQSEKLAAAVRRVRLGRALVANALNRPHGTPLLAGRGLVRRGRPVMKDGAQLKGRMQFAHGAQFVEVRIDRWTGQIRVPRMVGVFAAGRIMNPRTARAQLAGGQVWGFSSALHEETMVDRAYGRYVNQDLDEYHIPVSVDIGEVETIMLEESDKLVNPLGIKGVGELGVTGVNAAIC